MRELLFKAKGTFKPIWTWLWPLRELLRKSRLYTLLPVRWLSPSSAVLGPPKGFYPSTVDWVKSCQQEEAANRPCALEAYPASIVNRAQPRSIDGQTHWKFERDSSHESSAAFVAVIPGGRYWGYYGGNVITPDDMLLEDLSRGVRPGADHEIFLQLKLPALETKKGPVAILSAPESERNYFHWLFDVLPKVQLLAKANIPLDEIALFVTNMSGLSFQLETLSLVGLNSSKLLVSNRKLHLEAETLIVPSATINSSFDTPPWICQFLRRLLLDASERQPTASATKAELVYVTRSQAPFRRIVNEEEVRKLLEGLGFSTIALDQMSVLEQSRVFSSAKAIVSAHGAGLSNLVCCQPQTKVIELFSPNFVQTNYWGISSVLNLEYFYLFGEGSHPMPPTDPLNRYEDIKIDLKKLSQTLELAEIGKKRH